MRYSIYHQPKPLKNTEKPHFSSIVSSTSIRPRTTFAMGLAIGVAATLLLSPSHHTGTPHAHNDQIAAQETEADRIPKALAHITPTLKPESVYKKEMAAAASITAPETEAEAAEIETMTALPALSEVEITEADSESPTRPTFFTRQASALSDWWNTKTLKAEDYFDNDTLYKAPREIAELDDENGIDVSVLTEPVIIYPYTKAHTVQSGDVIGTVLDKAAIPPEEVRAAMNAMKKLYNPRNIRVGQTFHYTVDKKRGDAFATLTGLKLELDKVNSIQLSQIGDGGFIAKKETLPQIYKTSHGKGIIRGSLYKSAAEKDVPDGVIMELMKQYGYAIDFQRDIQAGDGFEVMYEKKQTETGITTGYGAIYYANLTLRGKETPIYRYKDSKGTIAFYHGNGESIVKSLLATPMNGARISSNFGMRKHPVLGYSKMHKGTDFAAPTGTPIYAAGDGTLEVVGTLGGYGKYIRIKHNGTYKTAYAHMSRYAKGMRKGARVKQGQVIGYVGSTGRSTGPHLHYEVIENGVQVNPRKKKFNATTKLAGNELKRFKNFKADTAKQLAAFNAQTERTLAGLE